MKLRILIVLLVIVAIPLIARKGRSRATHETPRVFAKTAYPEARTQLAQGALLVVDATASWCPPCQEMKATSWQDPAVEAWFAANGTAVVLDVDDQASDAEALKIEAMPTVIAFRNSNGTTTEIARNVGFLDATELLAWLKALKTDPAK